MSLLRRIRRGLTFLAVFLTAAVVGHMVVAGESLLDAIYFVVVTISTVGYAERSTASVEVKLLNLGTIIVGTVAVGYTIGLIVQSLIEGQINQALGIRRMTREIDQLAGHTIICGYGRIGKTLAVELGRRDKRFVIVDLDPEIAAAATGEGILVVTGDATDETTLLAAGIERAKTVIVAMKSDADNVFLTLTARNLNPELIIIARGEQPATEKKLRQAGANRVVLPAVIGARRMAALVTRPNAAEMLERFTNHEMVEAELEELTIPPVSTLVGKTVRETAARQAHHLLIVGIRRGDGQFVFNPNPDDDFRAADTLIVMGKRDDVEAFRKLHACQEAG